MSDATFPAIVLSGFERDLPQSASAAERGLAAPSPSKRHLLLLLNLPILLTGLTFLMSFAFQICESSVQRHSQEDTEWRKALEYVTPRDASGAALGAYEMLSFLKSAEHGEEARRIAITLLPKVNEHGNFDRILFDLAPGINSQNQGQIVEVASAVSSQIRDLHQKAMSDPRNSLRKDGSMAVFLASPDLFFEEGSQSDLLHEANERIWELDSVSRLLADNWRQNPSLDKTQVDLDGIIFWNGDFTGVDFTRFANVSGAEFFGKCKVDQAQSPAAIQIHCVKSEM